MATSPKTVKSLGDVQPGDVTSPRDHARGGPRHRPSGIGYVDVGHLRARAQAHIDVMDCVVVCSWAEGLQLAHLQDH